MRNSHGLLAAVLLSGLAPLAGADEVIVNGGFETEGFGGPADSANWIEVASGAFGTLSERVASPVSAGLFAHHLAAIGADGIGSTGVIVQNGVADGGLASLEQNTTVTATFRASVTLGPGGVGFYALRILNGAGAIVANSGLGVITNGTNGEFASFSMGPLTVPAFGEAPNDVYSAYVEIAVAAGAFPASTAEAYVDEVVVTGTLAAPGCPADFNGDAFVDFFDYDDYVNCFETGTCPPGKTGDFNGDGFADFFDYDDFVAAFEAGC